MYALAKFWVHGLPRACSYLEVPTLGQANEKYKPALLVKSVFLLPCWLNVHSVRSVTVSCLNSLFQRSKKRDDCWS